MEDKELLLMEQQIAEISDTAHKYYFAYNLLAEHFDKLPDDIQRELDVKLKEIDL